MIRERAYGDRAGDAAGAGDGSAEPFRAPRDDDTAAARVGTAPRVTGTEPAVVGDPSAGPRRVTRPPSSVVRLRIGPYARYDASAVRRGMTSAVKRSMDAIASASRMSPNIRRHTK